MKENKKWYQDRHELYMQLGLLGSDIRTNADKIAKHPSIVNSIGKAMVFISGCLRTIEEKKPVPINDLGESEVKAVRIFLTPNDIENNNL